MDISQWADKQFVLLADEDGGVLSNEDLEKAANFISANRQKYYLFPASLEVGIDEAISGLASLIPSGQENDDTYIAQDVVFPSSVQVRAADYENSASSLFELLKNIPDAKNSNITIILPQKDIDIAERIQRQLGFLRMYADIRSAVEEKNHACENKFLDHAEAFRTEIASLRQQWREITADSLRSDEGKLFESNIFAAFHDIEEYLDEEKKVVKLMVVGDQDGVISGVLEGDFSVTRVSADCFDDENAQSQLVADMDGIIFLADPFGQWSEKQELLLQKIQEKALSHKLIFAINRKAKEEHPAITPSIISGITKKLDELGYKNNPVFFLDACDILGEKSVFNILRSQEELFDSKKMLDLAELQGKDQFWAEKALQRISGGAEISSNEWLIASGIENLRKHCQYLNVSSETKAGQLVSKCSELLKLLDDNEWDMFLRSVSDEGEAFINKIEAQHDRIELLLELSRLASDTTARNGFLHEITCAIDDFATRLDNTIDVICTDFFRKTNFTTEDLVLLYNGKQSSAMAKALTAAEAALISVARNEKGIANNKIEDIIQKYQSRIEVADTRIDKTIHTISGSDPKIFVQNDSEKIDIDFPNQFINFFGSILTDDVLTSFALKNTDIICIQQEGFSKNTSMNIIGKRYYLLENFKMDIMNYLKANAHKALDERIKQLTENVASISSKLFDSLAGQSHLGRELLKKAFRKTIDDYSKRREWFASDLNKIENMRKKMNAFSKIWNQVRDPSLNRGGAV